MPDGIININKPEGMTSHDVVNAIRRKIKGTKVGHTGTLDPMAAGVLPVCLGQATRITEYMQSDDKKYRCEMTLGIESDTQDIWGTIIDTRPVNVEKEAILEAFKSFRGTIFQTPPIYSAIKVNGKKLYEYARKGQTVEIKSRQVEIYDISVLNIEKDKVLFDVSCSKGTYIRTLCHDIGGILGCGAVMSKLMRTKSGRFTIEDAIAFEDLDNLDISQYIFPIDYPLQHMGSAKIHDEEVYRKVINGCPLTEDVFDIDKMGNELYKIYYNEKFIAIGQYNSKEKIIKLKKVFNY